LERGRRKKENQKLIAQERGLIFRYQDEKKDSSQKGKKRKPCGNVPSKGGKGSDPSRRKGDQKNRKKKGGTDLRYFNKKKGSHPTPVGKLRQQMEIRRREKVCYIGEKKRRGCEHFIKITGKPSLGMNRKKKVLRH